MKINKIKNKTKKERKRFSWEKKGEIKNIIVTNHPLYFIYYKKVSLLANT